jgi:hypothetical protein
MSRTTKACIAVATCLLLACHDRSGNVAPASVRPSSRAVFLADPGPTSGPDRLSGRPWLAADDTGKAVLAYMVPGKAGLELRTRRFASATGWGPEEKALEGLKDPLWLAAHWAPVQGPVLRWCEQNDPALGHCHPALVLDGGHWRRLPATKAPEGTHAVVFQFPEDGPIALDHYVSGQDLERVERLGLEPGGSPRELFRFHAAPGSDGIECWDRGDGTLWGAAAIPAGRGGAAIVAERLRLDGSHSPRRVLGRVGGPAIGLTSTASSEGWAALAWSRERASQARLCIRVRTPERWLPAAELGPISRNDSQLADDLWMAGPDPKGRMAFAWVLDGRLFTARFQPGGGWTRPEALGSEVGLASWSGNRRGELVLAWGSKTPATRFHLRRWSWARGWSREQTLAMPSGYLPEPCLFDDGSGLLVGLASAGDGLVRPWTLALP